MQKLTNFPWKYKQTVGSKQEQRARISIYKHSMINIHFKIINDENKTIFL